MAENAREYLLDFAKSKNCDPWIRNVIYIFLDSDGNVAESDKERLVTELLDEKHEKIPIAKKTQSKTVNQRIDFVSLQHIAGVNALATDQTLRFGRDINIVYGLNGTGKSSYFRIINDIIGGTKKKSILGNIYIEEQEQPQARLKYQCNGNNIEYEWNDTCGPDETISTVRVFDTSYTAGLLKKRSSDELLFKPFRLAMFAELIALVEELLQRAHDIITAEEQSLPVIKTDQLREEISALFATELIEKDAVKIIRELSVFDEVAANRIKTVKGELVKLQQVNLNDKIRLESEVQCKKDVGYEAILIERFSTGYTFKNGDVVSNQLEDSEGNTAEAFKSLCFYYEKAGDRVIFSQDCYTSPIPPSGEIAAKAGETDIFYYAYRNKFVPSDYQMTEEDKEAEDTGQLVFSYGSDDIKIIDVQAVSWSDGDMHYELMQMDGKLSKAELIEMAKEIIK